MSSITFANASAARQDLICPVCGPGLGTHSLAVDQAQIDGGRLDLYLCSGCRSQYYGTANPVIGYDHAGFEPKYWLHYAQIGAGISSMLSPLFALGDRARGSLLDVGCGFGYVVDFWQRSGRGAAVGLESAVYGKLGRDLLGVEIYHEYYGQCKAIAGRKFDVVFASEVLEHVPDPTAFLKEIGQGLSETGILVITTPSATIVAPTSDPSVLRAALSPGYHFFLISKSALETVLRAAGFDHIVVRDSGHQLVAWASRQPFAEPDSSNFDWDGYLDYLEHLSESEDVSVKGGALYRLFRDCFNTGRHERAAHAFVKLSEVADQHYSIDLKNPDSAALLKSSDLIARLDRSPAWLSCALVFGALHVGKASGDMRTKLRMLDAGIQIFKHDIATTPSHTQEPSHLLPFAEHKYRIGLVDALRIEIPTGVGRKHGQETAPLNRSLIDEFVGSLASLVATILAAAPTALTRVSSNTIARWRRSLSKRLHKRNK